MTRAAKTLSKWERIFSIVILTMMAVIFGTIYVHARVELGQVQANPPLERKTLEFYMVKPAPGNPDAVTVRRLQDDYEQMRRFYLPLLKFTVGGSIVAVLTFAITSLVHLVRLWRPNPPPQLSADAALGQPSPGISQPER